MIGYSISSRRARLLKGAASPEEAPPSIPILTPAAAWDGTTTYAGRTVPTIDDMEVFGTLHVEQPPARFSEPPHMIVSASNHHIGICGWTADREQFDWVDVWMEGTWIRLTQRQFNPRTGVFEFCFTPQSRPGRNGDAEIYAVAKPKHGRPRLIGPLPIVLDTDHSATRIPRPERWVNSDPGVGSDVTTGGRGQSEALPWASITFALNNAPSGAIIHLRGSAPHQYPGGTFRAIDRIVEVRGQGTANTEIKRDTPGLARHGIHKLMFTNLHINCENFSEMYGVNAVGCVTIGQNVLIAREGSVNGPIDKGYPVAGNIVNGLEVNRSNRFFRNNEGQRWFFTESEIRNDNTVGADLYRNCTILASQDTMQIGGSNNAQNGLLAVNTNFTQFGFGEKRVHQDLDLVVASTSRSGDNTVITFSGSPNIGAFEGVSGSYTTNSLIRVLQSANGLAAGNRPFPSNADGSRDFEWAGYWVIASTSSSVTVVDPSSNLHGPSGLAPGDLMRAFVINHGDWFQTNRINNGAPPLDNVIIQNCTASGKSWQLNLLQGGWQSSRDFTGATTSGRNTFTGCSTSGNIATFAAAHGMWRWSWLMLQSGPQAGEARIVEEIISTTQVRLSAPFTADQTNVNWAARRAIRSIAIVNSIAHKPGEDFEFWQIEPGVVGLIWINLTVPGINNVGVSIGFNGVDLASDAVMFRRFFVADSIIRRISPGVAGFPPQSVWEWSNNHLMSGTNPATGLAADGNFWLGQTDPATAGYRVTSAQVSRTHTEGVLYPVDVFGNPRSSTSPIGAVAVRP